MLWAEDAEARSQRLGNPPTLLAPLYNNTATLIDDQGRHQEAIAMYEKSIALAQQMHDVYAEALAVNNVAVTWAMLGRDDKALPLYRQAYALWNGALGSALNRASFTQTSAQRRSVRCGSYSFAISLAMR